MHQNSFSHTCNISASTNFTQVVKELRNLIKIAKHGQRLTSCDHTNIELDDTNVEETTISFHKVRDIVVVV